MDGGPEEAPAHQCLRLAFQKDNHCDIVVELHGLARHVAAASAAARDEAVRRALDLDEEGAVGDEAVVRDPRKIQRARRERQASPRNDIQRQASPRKIQQARWAEARPDHPSWPPKPFARTQPSSARRDEGPTGDTQGPICRISPQRENPQL